MPSFLIKKDFGSSNERVIRRAIECLKANHQEVITIKVMNNYGGVVFLAKELIDAIWHTTSSVHVVYSGFIVSSAAFLFAATDILESHKANVVMELEDDVCLVFHKPRIELSNGKKYFHNSANLHELDVDIATDLCNISDFCEQWFVAYIEHLGYDLSYEESLYLQGFEAVIAYTKA